MVKNSSATETNDPPPLTVFFDGSCPICSKEIAFYKTRVGADMLSWIDISDEKTTITQETVSREELMARFHVQNSEGQLVSGGAAFAELWAALPAFKIIGKLFKLPVFNFMINIGYDFFLVVRPKVQKLFFKR